MLNARQESRFKHMWGKIIESVWAVLERIPLALKIHHRLPFENHSYAQNSTRDNGA